jgi:hypothetical protein
MCIWRSMRPYTSGGACGHSHQTDNEKKMEARWGRATLVEEHTEWNAFAVLYPMSLPAEPQKPRVVAWNVVIRPSTLAEDRSHRLFGNRRPRWVGRWRVCQCATWQWRVSVTTRVEYIHETGRARVITHVPTRGWVYVCGHVRMGA